MRNCTVFTCCERHYDCREENKVNKVVIRTNKTCITHPTHLHNIEIVLMTNEIMLVLRGVLRKLMCCCYDVGYFLDQVKSKWTGFHQVCEFYL